MAYYGSNYASNSGPPPPPGAAGGAYNNYGAYGAYAGGYQQPQPQQQPYSAYNNYGGYGAYPGQQPYGGQHPYPYRPPPGGAPSPYAYGGGAPGAPGAVPGFTAPMQQYGGGGYQQPQGMPPPQSNAYSQASYHQQQAASNAMQWQNFERMGLIDKDEDYEEEMRERNKKSSRRRHLVDEDEDEDCDHDEERRKLEERIERAEAKARDLQEKLENDEGAREELKNCYIREMMRRQDLSGTFEITQGTVSPFGQYDDEDLVAKWHSEEKSCDICGEDWDADYDCEYIRKAIRGWGTDEAAIIYLCSTRCNFQRNKMLKQYKTMYGRDLIKDLHGDTSGDFRDCLLGLFETPARYDAYAIKKSIYGLGTDEATLIEILFTRTNAQICEMVEEYNSITYEKRSKPEQALEQDIIDDVSGDFKRLLISAAQGNRNEKTESQLEKAVDPIMAGDKFTGMYQVNYGKLCNVSRCQQMAKELQEAGEERWGTDEETFNRIFSTQDPYTLRVVYDEYVKLTQRDLLNAVKEEMSGNARKALKAVIQTIKCRPMFFAQKLYKSMKGLGTKDADLIRIVVSRSELDMVQIKACFLEQYKQTLWNFIKDDTSGDYRKLLLGIVGKN